MKKIAVTAAAFARDVERIERLKFLFPGEVRINPKGIRLTPDELLHFLDGCEYAIVGLDMINESVLSRCPVLRVVSKYGVGLDNIDFEACEKFGVKIVYPKGINRRSVSEEVLGATLSLIRNLYVSSNLLKYKKVWKVNGGQQLSGKTVGVIGVGYTGSDVIELLKPFGCRVLANDILDKSTFFAEHGVIAATKEDIFAEADVITIHTPLTKDTYHMINADSLSKMKETAILINVARGGIIDEAALKAALQANSIGGAALDVFENEPAEDNELLEIPNLMCMPHIGGNSKEAVAAMGNAAIDNIMDIINGA